ncbi:MAG: tRNA methyltransferase, partial [Metallosphaera sp.]
MLPSQLKNVYVLRLGHRPLRDKRVTTHVALVARAFGARGIYIEGDDLKVVDKIRSTIGKWGGNYFTIDITSEPKKIVSEWKKDGGKVVHLTMYGINVPEIIDNIRQLDNI